MGLIRRGRRIFYIWSWRLRFWWLDTRGGMQARVALFCLACLVVVVQLVRMIVMAAMPAPAGEPVKAVYWWVVQLIIAIVAAAVSYAMRPKPQQPVPQQAKAPTVEDGLAVKDYFGTCWVEDEFLLAWKMMGTEPIKTKGGKK